MSWIVTRRSTNEVIGDGQRYCVQCGNEKPGSSDRSTKDLTEIQQLNTVLSELRKAFKTI